MDQILFEREMEGTIPIVEAPDSDGDGLPDKWEVQFGLDPHSNIGVHGANGDPDFDGLTNAEEYEVGTDPMAPDTDGGGEQDGSEVANGRDPYNAQDDLIATPHLTAKAKNGEIELQFAFPDNSTHIQIYRSTVGADNGYILLTTIPAAANYNDTAVENGHTYWYRIKVSGPGFISGWSDVASTTPRTDLIPPWGIIAINGGENLTHFTRVTVKLNYAPDAVEMRVSLDPKFTNVSWVPVTGELTMDIANTNGLQYIYAQFRDGAGNIGAGDGYTDITFAAITLELLAGEPSSVPPWVIGVGIAGVVIIIATISRRKGKKSVAKSPIRSNQQPKTQNSPPLKQNQIKSSKKKSR